MFLTMLEFTAMLGTLTMFASIHRSAVSLVAAFVVSGAFLVAALPIVPVA